MTSVLPAGHAADQVHRVVGLGAAHARGRLVQQDGVGAARDGDADLERALLGVGEKARGQVAPRLEVDVGEQPLGRLVERPLAASRCQNE